MIAVRELKKEDISQLINLHAEFLKDQYGRNKYSKGNFKVNKYSSFEFIQRGGRIPAPIHSFKN